ncbi:hypothetical protein HI914_00114 [Erysiphe necator]|nr:hypothetical protein HI914_00114 [Erysiphe necator]
MSLTAGNVRDTLCLDLFSLCVSRLARQDSMVISRRSILIIFGSCKSHRTCTSSTPAEVVDN